MSRPRRFTALRVARIGGWTAVATAGVAVAMTRYGPPAEAPEVPAIVPAIPSVAEAATTTAAPLPATPEGGLLVLYLSPTPGVPVEVRPPTTAPAPAPAPAPVVTTTAPAPPPVTSSGS